MSPRWPQARIALVAQEGAWSIIQKVRRSMEASDAPSYLIGEATDALLHAGREGTAAVAASWVSTEPDPAIAELLEELI